MRKPIFCVINLIMLTGIIDAIEDGSKKLVVSRVVLGFGYIAVEVDHSGVGLSANLSWIESRSCNVFKLAGGLAGSSVGDILKFSAKKDYISRAIALATINALNPEVSGALPCDVLDQIEIKKGDKVAMVGMIEPVAKGLSYKGCKVAVFDNRQIEHPLMRLPEEMPSCILDADLAIVTATTLLNDTLPGILKLTKNARDVILMGPSTPMLPDVFKSSGLTWLAGSRIIDKEMAFKVVMEGGGTKALLGGAIEKVGKKVM
ncbi:MAG: DUF364 domain-containing protein [Thermodesulfobacteriota bacterium]|nr:DUF364 domain-containing protein [Thermodesulfobacteriota bacterium]